MITEQNVPYIAISTFESKMLTIFREVTLIT